MTSNFFFPIAPLIPPTSPTSLNTTSPGESNDLFSLPLSDAAAFEEGLADVPENSVPGNNVKKDPSEDGDDGSFFLGMP